MDGFGTSPNPAMQSSIATFVATARQQQNVCKCVACFFFKNNIAESLIEYPDIVHVFAELGVYNCTCAASVLGAGREHAG
jgi:hypothetical protein